MHPMLNTAIKAARRAGSMINRASLDLERLQVARKGPSDYVTEVDQSVEAAIIDILKTAYPDHGFLGEESGEQPVPEGQAAPEYQWIIDPLDGTTNFIHGFPVYAVSIALAHRGQVVHGVIYDPARNELFTASRGGGAFLNDRRVRVSGMARFHDAMLSAYVPDSGGGVSPNSKFSGMLTGCASVRRMGASVLDLAYVACGRLDGFCGVNLKRWDLAAGGLLVLEAGGLISDFQGEQTWFQTGSVIAGTPKVFTHMLASLQS
ncbi:MULTISPECIES: inositol monophosphatase family protein [unclassified Pusillimonas]|uniref:inositol monophosphatase family protein n=1 Tax=unclassified Pusillimonas TaxID=2640016 RepID=UPI000B9C980E|nr:MULTISPECIES: inositol monophosphatase family protein [unclassified Pusillimonas]OXR49140.1 inositol monophosphatase [Pusillimonas sp. T2]ROT46019.1 inositol monophosphatase [Pusillimonas sp. NJUB218]